MVPGTTCPGAARNRSSVGSSQSVRRCARRGCSRTSPDPLCGRPDLARQALGSLRVFPMTDGASFGEIRPTVHARDRVLLSFVVLLRLLLRISRTRGMPSMRRPATRYNDTDCNRGLSHVLPIRSSRPIVDENVHVNSFSRPSEVGISTRGKTRCKRPRTALTPMPHCAENLVTRCGRDIVKKIIVLSDQDLTSRRDQLTSAIFVGPSRRCYVRPECCPCWR